MANRQLRRAGPSLQSLPPEIVEKILVEVCENGFEDLCKAKTTCKLARDIINGASFIKKVDVFIMQAPDLPLAGLTNFKNRCVDLENPSALFTKGAWLFFKQAELEAGLAFIRRSAEGGYDIGVYVYAILVRILNLGWPIQSGVADVSRNFIREARRKVDDFPDIAWPMFDPRPPIYDEMVNFIPVDAVYHCRCCRNRKWPRAWDERVKIGRMCDRCFWTCQKSWFSREFPKKVLTWPDQHHWANPQID